MQRIGRQVVTAPLHRTDCARFPECCVVRQRHRRINYDGFQSPAAGPASGRVSPESHDAIATISAWS